MLTKEIADIEKEIEKIEEQYKNCGFVFNHSSRETDGTHKKNLGNNTQPLYVWDWTCGKEVSICPRCKNRLNTNSKLKTLKQKLSTLKSAQQKFDKFKQEELEFLKLLNSVDNNKIGELIDQRITLFVSQQRNEHIGKSVSADELSSKPKEGKEYAN